jgi:uncharacterized membrane protein YqjE
MAGEPMEEQVAPPQPGLIGSLSAVVRNTMRLLLSRLELAALELSELRNHLMQLSVLFALAILAAWFAIAFGTATLIYLAWAAMGWKILLILAVAFTLLAVVLVWYVVSMVKQGKLALHATMAELKADRDALL